MTQWARAAQSRDQLVLFPQRLDEAVPPDHPVRLLEDILGQLDWSKWEARYDQRRGQPAIHPRVLAGVLLYGVLTRVRSSRKLEEALQVRLDFRWLAEGRAIDHTTLSEFRRKHPAQLKDLFVQVGMVARKLGFLKLQQLAFDGTRARANNRRSGSVSVAELRALRDELAAKFAEAEQRAGAEDASDEETFGASSSGALPAELSQIKERLAKVAAALEELARLEQSEETIPKRLPITDPQARITPNKEGGFAPNYTPLATVDVESGLIVSADVIAMTNEEAHLLPALEDVQEQFELPALPPEVLADGLSNTGANLEALHERNVTLYSPVPHLDRPNPAVREDPSQPVPQEQWDQLPTTPVASRDGTKKRQLDRSAFLYDQPRDCYWCPQGKQLAYRKSTLGRNRYQAEAADCAACPLRERCLKGKNASREVSRDRYEPLREEHARRMATPEARQKYARRREVGEMPFAIIKQHFGARQFLLRSLAKIRTEWRWLTTAFNLKRLMSLMQSRAGPALDPIAPNPLPA